MSESRPQTIKVFNGVDAAVTSPWYKLAKDKVMSVKGISGDTVLVEYRTHEDDTVQTLETFTADGEKANSDALYEVRFRVSVYSAGTINAFFSTVG